MRLWKKIKQWLEDRKHRKIIDKRLKELKERDPFIYD